MVSATGLCRYEYVKIIENVGRILPYLNLHCNSTVNLSGSCAFDLRDIAIARSSGPVLKMFFRDGLYPPKT